MKKKIAYWISCVLFYIGDKVSKTRFIDTQLGLQIYHNSMVWSVQVQDWACLDKPWTKIKEHENQ